MFYDGATWLEYNEFASARTAWGMILWHLLELGAWLAGGSVAVLLMAKYPGIGSGETPPRIARQADPGPAQT